MKNNKNGFALATVLFISSIIILITLNLLYFSSNTYFFINRNKSINKSFLLAESALKKSLSKINKNYYITYYKFRPEIDINKEIFNNIDDSIFSAEQYDNLNNYYKYFYNDENIKRNIFYRIKDYNWVNDLRINGLSKKIYEIDSISTLDNKIWTALNSQLEITRLSLFNYGLFFNEDLEIFSKTSLTYKGKIHSNGNLFIDTEDKIFLDSEITSSKDIIKGRINGNSLNGKVFIKDIYGYDKELNNTNDSKSENWITKSIDNWKGKVLNRYHDINHKSILDFLSIERNSFYEKNSKYKLLISFDINGKKEITTIKLLYNNNEVFIKTIEKFNNKNSQTINLNTINLPSDTFDEISFFDNNEGKNVKVTSIDIFKLQSILNAQDFIIYASRNDAIKDLNPDDNIPDNLRVPNGFLLKNASKLLYPLLFVSNNPVYIQGNFNLHKVINGNDINEDNDYYGNPTYDLWRPAIIISDSINLLSNSWNINYYNPPVDTTYNFTAISGFRNNINSNNFLLNLYRLSENFSNQKIKIRGSFIGIGKTNFSTGNFNINTNPTFDYSYDNSFSKYPFSEQMLDLIPSTTESLKIISNKKLINEQSSFYNELKSKKLL
ncbi:MAG: hypothetical protein KatS3mg068_1315 [Candidatus Sericytochromatia bacterium]|nr:MAG: hypothetical protein KatS3mg068_1315 [Candidatus Sericytochromatia bacterium]